MSSWARLGPAATARTVAGLVVDRLGTLTALTLDHPHGVVLRLPRRRLLVLSDPAAVKHVLVDHADRYAKGLGQAEAAHWFGRGILTAEGDAWRTQRRAVASRLAARTVGRLSDQVQALAECSVSAWASEAGQLVDPRLHIAQYTLDCLGLALGFPAPRAAEVVPVFDRLQDRVMVDTTTQRSIPPWLRPLDGRRRRADRELLERVAEECLATCTDPTAAWATPERLLTVLLAGYETTAATLAWTIYHLARRPDLQDPLAGPAAGDPAATHRRVTDIFREATRMRAPVWLISRRALTDDVIAGNRVRRGDDVAVCTHAVHRLPPWRRPEEFDPTRDGEGRRLEFGQGPRACPGGALAELEAAAWLTTACRRLRFDLVPGSSPRPVARLSQAPGPFLVSVATRRPSGSD